MDTPLYKLYLLKRTKAYFDLPADDWAALRQEITARQKALGIRDLINAEMGWSNERFEFFGVEFYPSAEAVQVYTRALADLGYFQYVDSESYLGIPMDDTYPTFALESSKAGEPPIYRLYMARGAAGAVEIPQEEQDQLNERLAEQIRREGGKNILSAYTRWNNEGWEYFGIERFPNLEALIRYSQFLSSIDWYRSVEACSYLGMAYSGLISGVEAEE